MVCYTLLMGSTRNLCTIYLFRHGQTEWNVQGKMQGHSDSPLTEEGVSQAKEKAQKLKDIKFSAIFSSDLGRTVHTAELLKLDRQLVVMTKKTLRERSFGKYDGAVLSEYKDEMKELFKQKESLSREEQLKFKFSDDYESDEELVSRFITALREIAVAYSNQTILVVSHGATLRTFLEHIAFDQFGQLPAGSIKNCASVKLESDGIDFFVKEVDEILIR